jgi:hypothetical protein
MLLLSHNANLFLKRYRIGYWIKVNSDIQHNDGPDSALFRPIFEVPISRSVDIADHIHRTKYPLMPMGLLLCLLPAFLALCFVFLVMLAFLLFLVVHVPVGFR